MLYAFKIMSNRHFKRCLFKVRNLNYVILSSFLDKVAVGSNAVLSNTYCGTNNNKKQPSEIVTRKYKMVETLHLTYDVQKQLS